MLGETSPLLLSRVLSVTELPCVVRDISHCISDTREITRLELRRLRTSNVGARGDDVETVTGDARPDEVDDFVFAAVPLPPLELKCRMPLLRRKPKGESVDESELRVDIEFLLAAGSSGSFFLSFLALCSPTSSRSGSVQMTSHMANERDGCSATDLFCEACASELE